nr:VWA domain-containing protein [Acidobacteriota bacterium]
FEEVGIVSRRTVKFGKPPAEQILLIDEINAEFANLAYARYCIGKLLRKNGGRLDQPSSLMALTNEGLVLLHEATRDGNALFSALDSRGPNLPLLLGLGGRHNEMERISISLAAMHEIAAAGAGSNVRRNIIWISPGFPIISNSDIGAKSRSGLFESIRLLSAELLQARMIVYTVDPRGVPSNFGSIDVSSKGFGQYTQSLAVRGSLNFPDLALQRFARETGGKSFWGRNDLDNEIAKSMADGAGYYTVSYYPVDNNFDGKFRNLAVKINRPGLKARTRMGYFALPDAPPATKDQLTTELEKALSNPVPYIGIQLMATSNAVANDAHLQRISVKLDRHDLTCKPSQNDGADCALIAATASFTSKAKPLEVKSHSFAVNVAGKTRPPLSDEPVTVDLTVPFGEQISRVRVIIRDEASGRMGSVDLGATGIVAQ